MKELLHFFEHILNSIENKNTVPNVNPTEIFNEGWMTRLLVYQSIKEKICIDGLIDFKGIKNWSSEGLISSPFIKVKKNREGYTHADMCLGDFTIDYRGRGEISVSDNASIFGIIEAKMGSNLSQGTTHAPEYNQTSRNLACIAENAKSEDCKTFFAVVAPSKIIEHHNIKGQTEKEFMIKQIHSRFELSGLTADSDLIKRAEKCVIKALSYEDWIDILKETDMIKDFYANCLKWNRIK